LNISLPSTTESSKRYYSFRFLHQNPVCISAYSKPAQLIPLEVISVVVLAEQYKSSLCSFLLPPVTACHFDANTSYVPQQHIFEHPQSLLINIYSIFFGKFQKKKPRGKLRVEEKLALKLILKTVCELMV